MRPFKVLDPRSPLDRVSRDQMREYAERNGITEITWDMMGDEMKYILQKKGIHDIGAPHQILGSKANMEVRAANDGTPTISLEEMQRQEFERRARERAEAQNPAPKKRGRPKKVVNGQ